MNLREIAKAVQIEAIAFRCCGHEWKSAYDIIYAGDNFHIAPPELQLTLEALDDPLIRDYYGLEYCVVTGP